MPAEDNPDLTYVHTKAREIMRAAGLRGLTFTSFRHGGLTEMGDAELTDRQIMAQSRHRSSKVLRRYVKKTARQIAAGTRKRRAVRESLAEE
jgi:integrase